MNRFTHSDNPIHVERRHEEEALEQLSVRHSLLKHAVERALWQLSHNRPIKAKELLDEALKTDRGVVADGS